MSFGVLASRSKRALEAHTHAPAHLNAPRLEALAVAPAWLPVRLIRARPALLWERLSSRASKVTSSAPASPDCRLCCCKCGKVEVEVEAAARAYAPPAEESWVVARGEEYEWFPRERGGEGGAPPTDGNWADASLADRAEASRGPGAAERGEERGCEECSAEEGLRDGGGAGLPLPPTVRRGEASDRSRRASEDRASSRAGIGGSRGEREAAAAAGWLAMGVSAATAAAAVQEVEGTHTGGGEG